MQIKHLLLCVTMFSVITHTQAPLELIFHAQQQPPTARTLIHRPKNAQRKQLI
jgi:hypothetical protein